MSAMILDGKALAQRIKADIAAAIGKLDKSVGLGTILVGNDPGSVAYVEGKHRDCAEVGIKSIKVNLPATSTTDEVIAAVNALNTAGVDTQKVLSAINPAKDADGLTPNNLGNLVLGFNSVVACTPKAIVALLTEYKINLSGVKVLVIGRGMTVGRPLSILLSQKPINSTVTLAHSASKNLMELIKESDVVIAAMGSAKFIKAEMVKKGSVLVDVGITRDGNQLVGDFDPKVIEVASAFAPMPGGVGPMTRVMLLKNVIELARNEK
jgi:methylenetetrahydrofolate dehydrogenase (NADP+)/methenyltetrahydrofolate cyclohydrolase